MWNSEAHGGRIVFTARNDAGDEFHLVAYTDGTTGLLKNQEPFGERCAPGGAEPCIRLLLEAIGFAVDR